ncbi:MAG: hypothetical protein Q9187_004574 [Circinaria calcarea]
MAPALVHGQPHSDTMISGKLAPKTPSKTIKQTDTKPQAMPPIPVNSQASNVKAETRVNKSFLRAALLAAPPKQTPAAEFTVKTGTKGQNLVVTDLETTDFASLITSAIVTLYVGPKRKQYSPHKDLLCRIVPWFSKALLGDASEESKANEMYLPSHDPAAFDLFVLWLYRGKDGLSEPTVGIGGHVNLYILAEEWSLTTLQNSLIDVLADWFKVNQLAGIAAITEFATFYGTIAHLKPLRQFITQQTIHLMTGPLAHGQSFSKICSSHNMLAVDIACQYCEMLEGVGGAWKIMSKITKKDFYV